MADVDLTNYSLEELKSLQSRVNRAIDTYEERRKKEALAAVEAKAREMGFSLADLAAPTKKGKMPLAPKFQHPENPDLTWSGRGRQPQWFKDGLAEGKVHEDFLIVK